MWNFEFHLRLLTIWASLTPSKALRRAVSVETSWEDFSSSWKPRRYFWSVTGSIKNRIQMKYTCKKHISCAKVELAKWSYKFFRVVILRFCFCGPLPQTNSSALKKKFFGAKRTFIFQPIILQGKLAASFKECNGKCHGQSSNETRCRDRVVKPDLGLEKKPTGSFLFGSSPTVWVGGLMFGV